MFWGGFFTQTHSSQNPSIYPSVCFVHSWCPLNHTFWPLTFSLILYLSFNCNASSNSYSIPHFAHCLWVSSLHLLVFISSPIHYHTPFALFYLSIYLWPHTFLDSSQTEALSRQPSHTHFPTLLSLSPSLCYVTPSVIHWQQRLIPKTSLALIRLSFFFSFLLFL